MTDDASSPFWRFSLALYGWPGVAPACLRLQDDADADVNALFYAIWIGTQRGELTAAQMDEIASCVAAWRRDVVAPLRAVRRFLKTPPNAFASPGTARLRADIKRSELESERLEQEALFGLRMHENATAADPETAIAANIRRYESAIHSSFSGQAVLTIEVAALDLVRQGGSCP